MAAVPEDLIDACALVGPADRIREQLQRWKYERAPRHVSSMLLGSQDPEALKVVAGNALGLGGLLSFEGINSSASAQPLSDRRRATSAYSSAV